MTLVEVAEFNQQLVGVAVSAAGRVFISFPRNGIDDVKKSVAEVINGKAVPYPNEAYNTLNTAEPTTHFLSAQSVYVDSSDTLWVLDTGNLGSGTPLIEGGPKLVAINLTTNAVTRTIAFPDSLLGTGTSLNDVRFDLKRGTAGFAYLSDSSAKQGSGIIVVNLATGQAVRRLANDPSVLPDPSYRAVIEGRSFVTQAKATDAPSLLTIACDGIAVSADGKLVYYCPIASRYLYAVSADALTDFTVSDAAVAATVKNVGEKGEVGGLEADAQGRIYLTNGEYNAVRRFDPAQGTAGHVQPVVRDAGARPAPRVAGFDGVGQGRDALRHLDAGEPAAGFQRRGGRAAAAVHPLQGADGRDAGDAVAGSMAGGVDKRFVLAHLKNDLQ